METGEELASVALDQDIPPAIACARCGRGDCDGCEPELAADRPAPQEGVPWEREPSFASLLSSAFLSSEAFERMFPREGPSGAGRALAFAVFAEFLAVSSFAVPWAAAFILLFPQLSLNMATSPLVWLFASLVLFGLVALVVGIHLVWGLVLEWQVARHTATSRYGQGVRFGLYACGWDLVTSPAGAVAAWLLYGRKAMLPRLKRAAAAPRASLRYYTQTLRQLEEGLAKRAILRSFLVTSLAFFGLVFAALGLLVWSVVVYHVL